MFDAIDSDPDRVNDAINGASAPTASSICDAMQLESTVGDQLDNVYTDAC